MTKRSSGGVAAGIALAVCTAFPAAAQSGQPAPAFTAPVIGDTGSLPGPRQPIFFRHDVRTIDAAEARAAAAAERSPWRDGPFLALAGLMLLLALVSFQVVSTFPLTLRAVHHFSESRIGLALSVNTLIIVQIGRAHV